MIISNSTLKTDTYVEEHILSIAQKIYCKESSLNTICLSTRAKFMLEFNFIIQCTKQSNTLYTSTNIKSISYRDKLIFVRASDPI